MKRRAVLGLVGGLIYLLIEILWSGSTHWTMGILGGICFVLIGEINEYFTFSMPLWKQCFIATFIVLLSELLAGLFLNVYLQLNIWDYSHLPFNILGQICLYYAIAWFFLALPAIVLDDWCRYLWFGEEKPHYVFF